VLLVLSLIHYGMEIELILVVIGLNFMVYVVIGLIIYGILIDVLLVI
jgi:hypothetical protein